MILKKTIVIKIIISNLLNIVTIILVYVFALYMDKNSAHRTYLSYTLLGAITLSFAISFINYRRSLGPVLYFIGVIKSLSHGEGDLT